MLLSSGTKRELTWIITSLSFFVLLGWVFNHVLSALFAFFLFYIARQLWSLNKFEKWVSDTSSKSFPPATGFWSELTYLVSKKQRALEKNINLNLYKSEQFKSASMLIPDAIISLDRTNKIEWFNRVSRSLIGIRRQDVGSRIESVIRHPDFIKYLRSAAFGKTIKISGLNQQSRTYEVQIIRYFENHKLLVVRDITELYQLAQIRRDFIANASHELRTPLTVLKGYLEIMMDHRSELSQWSVPLEHMETQSYRMQSIIEDLLTLSSLEAESITAKKEPLDVPAMIDQLQADSLQLGTALHTFSFEVDRTLKIRGYEEPFKSVLMNLLSNAVRYSPDGGHIVVRWYRYKEQAIYEVQDEGLGISSEHIPRLTERFYRVDKDRSRVTGGTGLGLAIVKHVLERHDGKLDIDSLLGKGSTFKCTFSLADVD